MNKVSIKLGTIFFLLILLLETFMFFFLHSALVDSRVEEELISLQTRGNSHRAILERDFHDETIAHVALMEWEASTDVVVTDQNRQILDTSVSSDLIQEYIERAYQDLPWEGKIVEDNWKEEPFIATVSPVVINEEITGYVYMFQHTESIHSLIKRLNDHFLLTGFIVVGLTFIIIIFTSKALATPLVKMKEATSKISKGDFSVSLPKGGHDELGDLAHSIQLLASDLNYLKQERNEFLSSISHELRTPLTYIKGYADILRKRELTLEERHRYLNIIHEETNRLSNLVEDLFDLAKIDKNTFEIQTSRVDLTEFIMKLNDKFTPAFEERGIAFDVHCPDNLSVMADSSRLEQIMINLLDNAMKYSGSEAHVVLSVTKHKGFVKIKIKDNGPGIPKKDLPHIFNRFYRVEKSRTRAAGGVGMGLAIVKELVHAHGGTISVKSEEKKGTEFELLLMGEEKT